MVRATGAAFSVGLDPQPSAGDPEELDWCADAFAWLSRNDVLSVAVVQGVALGAGCELALACDLRLLADDARLALPQAAAGSVPSLGATHGLVATVGFARALELCLTGREVTAREAASLRLAELVVPAADLEPALSDLVSALLAAPRHTAVEVKALLRAAGLHTAAEQRAAEQAAADRCRLEPDTG